PLENVDLQSESDDSSNGDEGSDFEETDDSGDSEEYVPEKKKRKVSESKAKSYVEKKVYQKKIPMTIRFHDGGEVDGFRFAPKKQSSGLNEGTAQDSTITLEQYQRNLPSGVFIYCKYKKDGCRGFYSNVRKFNRHIHKFHEQESTVM